MGDLLVLPVAMPLIGAAAQILFRRRLLVQRIVSFTVMGAALGAGLTITASVFEGPVMAVQMGGWPAGFAIPFAADVFSGVMVSTAALMVLICTWFACAAGDDDRPFFHPLTLILSAGVFGAFLTADLFNLFVFFEMMLIASYLLLVLNAGAAQMRAGVVYVAANLIGSAILVGGVALIYGSSGTVNLAELAGAAERSPDVAVGAVFVMVAFSVKSSLVPVHGWLPASYPAASPSVTALFSGLLTKAGVYGLFRVYTMLFGAGGAYRSALIVVASITMIVGVLGAVGQGRIRSILSFHIVSQVGYMVAGLALLTPLGIAAGIFYIVHHIGVKTSLLLSAGAVEKLRGTGDLDKLGGVASSHSVLAFSFILAAFSLAGLPPLSGFFAKLTVVRAALVDEQFGLAAVAIGVGVLTLVSMIKIWNEVFWSPDPLDGAAGREVRAKKGLIAPALFLAVLSLAIGVWPEGLLRLSTDAAAGLLDRSAYVEAVMRR